MSLPNNGDVVMLRSGGPRMTVIGTNGTIRTCGWFSYNTFQTMAADAASFTISSQEADVDTLTTTVIPRVITGLTPDSIVVSSFTPGMYSVSNNGGIRSMHIDALIPDGSGLDLMAMTYDIEFEFADTSTASFAAIPESMGAKRYFNGILMQVVRLGLTEPEAPPSP